MFGNGGAEVSDETPSACHKEGNVVVPSKLCTQSKVRCEQQKNKKAVTRGDVCLRVRVRAFVVNACHKEGNVAIPSKVQTQSKV